MDIVKHYLVGMSEQENEGNNTFNFIYSTILDKTTWENVFINAHFLTQQNYFQINSFA